jgi:hypothetical protein
MGFYFYLLTSNLAFKQWLWNLQIEPWIFLAATIWTGAASFCCFKNWGSLKSYTWKLNPFSITISNLFMEMLVIVVGDGRQIDWVGSTTESSEGRNRFVVSANLLRRINFFQLTGNWWNCVPRPVIEAYDKMQGELVKAKKSLTKILTSKDVKATVCTTLFTHQSFNSNILLFFCLVNYVN